MSEGDVFEKLNTLFWGLNIRKWVERKDDRPLWAVEVRGQEMKNWKLFTGQSLEEVYMAIQLYLRGN